jgi:7-cyano-7-deazaguanine reductase
MKNYDDKTAKKGTDAKLPSIEYWPSQYSGYEIRIDVPEFTSVCPKTKLPDFGCITLIYMPDKKCIELKSFKYYILAYRDLGIFYENAVNRILKDVVESVKPKWAVVKGKFSPRGGISTEVRAVSGKIPPHIHSC